MEDLSAHSSFVYLRVRVFVSLVSVLVKLLSLKTITQLYSEEFFLKFPVGLLEQQASIGRAWKRRSQSGPIQQSRMRQRPSSRSVM